MRLQPAIVRLCQELNLEHTQSQSTLSILKTCVAIDNQFIYVTAFGNTAEYLAKYGKKGGRVLFKDWDLEVKRINDKTVYDFTVRKLDVIDYKEV